MFIMTTRTILVFGKKGRDMETRYQKIQIGKNDILRLSGKWINSSGVSSQKLSYVRLLPQGLLFLKNKHSWNFKTCSFWRNCTLAHIWTVSQSISGIYSQKLSYDRLLPQGLLFCINRHFWNFRTCSFWRNCTFAHIWTVSQSISRRSPFIWTVSQSI